MFLKVEHIVKTFGSQHVLSNVSFDLDMHKTLSILGKSGCGKTTLLKIIAGLLANESGNIVLDGVNINKINPNKRDVVYIYQEPLLFPHLSVVENIAFGLRIRKMTNESINKEVADMVQALELSGHEHKLPAQLSGGQKQRVAFGRAIIIKPKLLLLDEPFGNLDTETRSSMQTFFKKICGTFGITSLFVTHDLKEALLMGDKFGFMKDGVLKIYHERSEFVEDSATGVNKEIEFWKNL